MLTIIRPKKTFGINDLKEIWLYRELFYTLAIRDIKIRYKQTSIGIIWAVLQPFAMMVVFTLFFGRLAGISSGEIPYPLFTYSGLIFWSFFANSISSASNSLLGGKQIIQKVFFPKMILPVSTVVVFLIDFFFSLLVFFGLMVYYHFLPSFSILFIIPTIIVLFFLSVGIGLITSSLIVKYRDIQFILPFFVQFGLFVTPVIYPSAILHNHQWVLFLNPLAGIIEAGRASLLGTAINLQTFGISCLITLAIFILGIFIFTKTEKNFADII